MADGDSSMDRCLSSAKAILETILTLYSQSLLAIDVKFHEEADDRFSFRLLVRVELVGAVHAHTVGRGRP